MEVLFVMSITITILSLTLPLQHKVIQHVEEKKFFEQLQTDMLFLQSATVTNYANYKFFLYPEDHRYEIRAAPYQKLILRREFPSYITILPDSFPIPFYFNRNGTPSKPSTFHVLINNKKYKVTFPFGKGRFYVTEQ
jgi:competence protein ComGD